MADPARVFISYSSKDTDLVDRLKTALARAGLDVWLDHEQLTPGTPDWRAAVVRGIEQATDVVYAASLDAAESLYVGHELAIATDEGKRILPFWVRGEKWSRCAPMGYYYAQYIDGRDVAYAAGLAKLLATLGVSSAASAVVAEPTPARPQRAQDSDQRSAKHAAVVPPSVVAPPQPRRTLRDALPGAPQSGKHAAVSPPQRSSGKHPVPVPGPAVAGGQLVMRVFTDAKARPNLVPVGAEFGAMERDKRLLPNTKHSITVQNAGEGMASNISAVLFPSAVYFDENGRPQGDPPLLGTYWAGRVGLAVSPGATCKILLEEARWPLPGDVHIAPQYTLSAPAQPPPVVQRGNFYCRAHDHKFNLVLYPPRVPGICDLDGSELYWRADESPENVVQRPGHFFSARLTLTCRDAAGTKLATVFDLDADRLAQNLDDIWEQVLLPTEVEQTLHELTDHWAEKRKPPRLGG